MIDPATLARMKNNDKNLTKLTLTNMSKTDLYALLEALRNNTFLCELEFPYKHLLHASMSPGQIADIENVASQINKIVKKNRDNVVSTPPQNAIPKQSYTALSKELKSDLVQSANNALQRDWSMPRVAQPLTPEDIQFLESHTINDLLNIKKNNNDFSLKGILLQILIGTATTLAGEYLNEFLKAKDPAQPAKEPQRKLASIEANDEKSPESSEAKVVKKLALKKAQSITMKEMQKKLTDGLRALPETGLNVSQSDADKLAKLTQDNFKKVVASAAFISKIAEDPSREKLVETTVDFTKKFLIDQAKDTAKSVLLNAGTSGILIAKHLNPILLVVEGVFESYEIDARHEADKPPLPMWPYPPLPKNYDLKPVGPALYPDTTRPKP